MKAYTALRVPETASATQKEIMEGIEKLIKEHKNFQDGDADVFGVIEIWAHANNPNPVAYVEPVQDNYARRPGTVSVPFAEPAAEKSNKPEGKPEKTHV
jgi:hypothetical protein